MLFLHFYLASLCTAGGKGPGTNRVWPDCHVPPSSTGQKQHFQAEEWSNNFFPLDSSEPSLLHPMCLCGAGLLWSEAEWCPPDQPRDSSAPLQQGLLPLELSPDGQTTAQLPGRFEKCGQGWALPPSFTTPCTCRCWNLHLAMAMFPYYFGMLPTLEKVNERKQHL